MGNTLLLTWTIAPSLQIENKSSHDLNMDKRKKDYLRAIIYYITQSNFDAIIFCDNSNTVLLEYDVLEQLAKRYNKQLEILSFPWDDSLAIVYWYGCGEAEIFDYVCDHSKLLKNCDSFYKITWRYILRDVNVKLNKLKDIPNYFHKQWLFMTQFTTSTAFFKISKINYQKYLYKKQISFYKALYKQEYKEEFFFKNHFPLERVWYLLLRQELLQYKQNTSFPVIYDYPKILTHWFNVSFRNYVYAVYCFLKLNQYWYIHKLLDMVFFEKTYKKLINDVLSHLG